jgi:hypothetical protein
MANGKWQMVNLIITRQMTNENDNGNDNGDGDEMKE